MKIMILKRVILVFFIFCYLPTSVLANTHAAEHKRHIKKHAINIIIDAGHGGKDAGAVGAHGTTEKSIVFAISQQLAAMINQTPGLHATLTRQGDYFVSLRDRLNVARQKKADLFISIHADSFLDNHSTGASVYTLSRQGASSEAARWLATQENHSELGGVKLSALNDQFPQLRSIIIDLAQTATINDSLHLGNTLLSSFNQSIPLHYPLVEQAPFVVLKSPDIPSILVETGFISNPDEEVKLRDKQYQLKLSQAIFTGIREFLKKYPPE